MFIFFFNDNNNNNNCNNVHPTTITVCGWITHIDVPIRFYPVPVSIAVEAYIYNLTPKFVAQKGRIIGFIFLWFL